MPRSLVQPTWKKTPTGGMMTEQIRRGMSPHVTAMVIEWSEEKRREGGVAGLGCKSKTELACNCPGGDLLAGSMAFSMSAAPHDSLSPTIGSKRYLPGRCDGRQTWVRILRLPPARDMIGLKVLFSFSGNHIAWMTDFGPIKSRLDLEADPSENQHCCLTRLQRPQSDFARQYCGGASRLRSIRQK
jgi:hypothetical protein